jgi:hypothetical protein
MLNIHTELSSGVTSKGYNYDTEAEAVKAFERITSQLTDAVFVGDLVMVDGGIEVQRETFPVKPEVA